MKNIAIITGASSGMGRDFSATIANKFELDEIWLISRRKDRLIQLSEYIKDNYNLNSKVIDMDLTDISNLDKIDDMLKSQEYNVKILVNASGFGMIGNSYSLDRKKQEEMILLNSMALFSLTHICLKYMSKGSGIIQIASAAALCPQPYFAVYAATKSFVLSYSMALKQELKPRGIKVTCVCPGPVDTEFFDVCKYDETSNKNKIIKKIMKTSQSIVKDTMKGYYKGKNVVMPGYVLKLAAILAGIPMKQLSTYIFYKLYK